ncbi:hypothetical protein BJV82DRAFT_674242 [Fennellomyces sp. T-0311]|nr:hypothetical protein BJV82DRAFT_674242 [Fennellomyces sp. T-0311]
MVSHELTAFRKLCPNSLFTFCDYEVWVVNDNRNNEWVPVYIKSLGILSQKDIHEYFSALDVYTKEFHVSDTKDHVRRSQ